MHISTLARTMCWTLCGCIDAANCVLISHTLKFNTRPSRRASNPSRRALTPACTLETPYRPPSDYKRSGLHRVCGCRLRRPYRFLCALLPCDPCAPACDPREAPSPPWYHTLSTARPAPTPATHPDLSALSAKQALSLLQRRCDALMQVQVRRREAAKRIWQARAAAVDRCCCWTVPAGYVASIATLFALPEVTTAARFDG